MCYGVEYLHYRRLETGLEKRTPRDQSCRAATSTSTPSFEESGNIYKFSISRSHVVTDFQFHKSSFLKQKKTKNNAIAIKHNDKGGKTFTSGVVSYPCCCFPHNPFSLFLARSLQYSPRCAMASRVERMESVEVKSRKRFAARILCRRLRSRKLEVWRHRRDLRHGSSSSTTSSTSRDTRDIRDRRCQRRLHLQNLQHQHQHQYQQWLLWISGVGNMC